jgi:phage tail-like protein
MGTSIPAAKPSCRFYVQIDGVAQAVFTELSGLSMEMTVEDVEEGGNNGFVHRLPGRGKVSNLTLKRGMTTSNDFLKWMTGNVAGTQFRTANVSVILFNPDGSEAMRWNFNRAYPVKWSGPQFKADDTAIAIESVEFAHEGLSLG